MMSDCNHCLDTPCTCGYEYISLPFKSDGDDAVEEQIKMLKTVLVFRKNHKAAIEKMRGLPYNVFAEKKEALWKLFLKEKQ